MNCSIKLEYSTPMTTMISILTEPTVICASGNRTSVQSFEEDEELVW